jgi:HEPN domain-containing protein
MNKNDLKKLALARLREANVLLENGEFSGAYYLAGYVVKCALKAVIAKQTRRHDFPDKNRANDSWIHDPTRLVGVAGLQAFLQAEIKFDPKFAESWNVVKDWKEDSRYKVSEMKEAEAIIQAIADRRHGVLRWLKRHW